jgi:hypothetical protein
MIQSKVYTRLLVAAGAALTALALLAPAANAATPAPGYERFAGCPSTEEDPNVLVCSRSVVKSGHFQMGSKTVPISKPITLTGGIDSSNNIVFNSKGGLEPVKQEVPGGLVGLTGLDWLVNFLTANQLKLYAVTELAGTPRIEEGLELPIKVHLVNPALGNKCYVGSDSNPIDLHLTTGTTNPPPPNEPISGHQFESFEEDALGVLHLNDNLFVDNAFAAPGANGCTLTVAGLSTLNIDGLVNLQSGLPSPAGTNETQQVIDLETVYPNLVYP